MNIIIDTREQKPLRFTGHETIRRKLDEGDYNIPELIDKIVIERKSIPDLYSSITRGHERFKSEIVRSRLQGKTFYLFLEGDLSGLLRYAKKRKMKPETIEKMINTMIERYQIILVTCESRSRMSELIVQTFEINKKLNAR